MYLKASIPRVLISPSVTLSLNTGLFIILWIKQEIMIQIASVSREVTLWDAFFIHPKFDTLHLWNLVWIDQKKHVFGIFFWYVCNPETTPIRRDTKLWRVDSSEFSYSRKASSNGKSKTTTFVITVTLHKIKRTKYLIMIITMILTWSSM